MRPVNLMALADCRELDAAKARHPAVVAPAAGKADRAAPPKPAPVQGRAGQRDGWRCHQPDCGFSSNYLTGKRGIETHCHAAGHLRYDLVLK